MTQSRSANAPTTPTLILTGDEDWLCLAPSVMMKQEIPTSALSVMPNCGHTVNIEDPDLFKQIVGDFIAQVDCGRWPKRDPRAMANSSTGMKSQPQFRPDNCCENAIFRLLINGSSIRPDRRTGSGFLCLSLPATCVPTRSRLNANESELPALGEGP